jgi:hypothetical protein
LQLIHDSEPSGQLLFLVQKQLPDSVLQTLMLARLLYKFTKKHISLYTSFLKYNKHHNSKTSYSNLQQRMRPYACMYLIVLATLVLLKPQGANRVVVPAVGLVVCRPSLRHQLGAPISPYHVVLYKSYFVYCTYISYTNMLGELSYGMLHI